MKRYRPWILYLIFIALAGCTGLAPRTTENPPKKWENSSIALTDIDKVQIGMTYNEVVGIMGETVHVGYRTSPVLKGDYEDILVKNPYHEEILEGPTTRYRLVYYFTHIKKADGIVTTDELTPLVFEENRLIGKGRKFLLEFQGRVR